MACHLQMGSIHFSTSFWDGYSDWEASLLQQVAAQMNEDASKTLEIKKSFSEHDCGSHIFYTNGWQLRQHHRKKPEEQNWWGHLADNVSTQNSHLNYFTTQLYYYQFCNQHYKLWQHSTCVLIKSNPSQATLFKASQGTCNYCSLVEVSTLEYPCSR